jgi:ketosteroid isomerase-like protein
MPARCPCRFALASFSLLLACGETGTPDAPGAKAQAAGGPSAPASAVDPVENFLESIRAYNENSVEGLLATYAEDATWEMPGSGAPSVEGRKRIVRQGVAFKTGFPESRFGVRRILVDGQTLVAQTVFRATRRFDEQGVTIPPRELGYEAIQSVETDRGFARRTLVLHDQVGIRQQIGRLTGPAPVVPTLPEIPEVVRGPAPAGNIEAVAGLHAAWEKGDFASWKDLVTEGFELVDHATGDRFDLARALDWLAARDKEFDSVLFERQRTVAVGSWVAVFFVELVDYRRPDASAEEPPSRLSVHGAHVMRLEGGRIAALEIYRNRGEFLRQMGAAVSGPPKDGTGAAADAGTGQGTGK